MWTQILHIFLFLTCLGYVLAQDPRPDEYMVAILEKDLPICAGAFIHKQYAVTTAKCVYKKTDLKIALSSAQPVDQNQKKGVVRTHVHPYYRAPLSDYDIAVLKVDTVGDDANIKTLDLPAEDPVKVDYMFTGGWNAAEEQEGLQDDKTFRNGASDLVERDACKAEISSLLSLSRKLFCIDNSKSEYPFVDGVPAVTIKQDEHIKNLIGVATRKFNATKSLPWVFVNVANPEIKVFLDTIVN